jgi:hypothetical protein
MSLICKFFSQTIKTQTLPHTEMTQIHTGSKKMKNKYLKISIVKYAALVNFLINCLDNSMAYITMFFRVIKELMVSMEFF